MYPYQQKTLDLLRKRKRKGITFEDFPVGFRLSAAIYDLRKMEYQITTTLIEICNGRKIANYFLIKEKE